jgi:short-subunit dehydrogenase
MQLQNSVLVVTGASRGIGRSVAVAAAARGAKVGLVARSQDELDQTLAAIGGRGATAAADVGDHAQVSAAIAAIEAELGPVDALVANAGIGAYGAFADENPEHMEQLLRVNVLGTMHAVHAVLPGMISRRRGQLVALGSIAGKIGAPFEAIYSASKFAQVGLMESLAVELTPYGIGVATVNPGPVATDFFDARGHAYDRTTPRQVSPERVAAAVIRALESGRSEQVVPRWLGQAVVFRHLVPPLYRWGARRNFRTELAEDQAKRA